MKGTVKSDGAMIGGFHEAVVYFKAEVRTLVTHPFGHIVKSQKLG